MTTEQCCPFIRARSFSASLSLRFAHLLEISFYAHSAMCMNPCHLSEGEQARPQLCIRRRATKAKQPSGGSTTTTSRLLRVSVCVEMRSDDIITRHLMHAPDGRSTFIQLPRASPRKRHARDRAQMRARVMLCYKRVVCYWISECCCGG